MSGLLLVVLVGALLAPAHGGAMGKPSVAALQVALKSRGLYSGSIDGLAGPQTSGAVRTLQSHAGLAADGVVGPKTRKALGKLGRHTLGSRVLKAGRLGWDVAALQFLLAWHGFPSGTLDGAFGPRLDAALRRYQVWRGLQVDGVAGPGTIESLRAPPARCPLQLAWPLRGQIGDRFGPRGERFHAGVDIPAPRGARVSAARAGRVVYEGWAGTFGRLVSVEHESGVVTMYAHLSGIAVRLGQWVERGRRIGRVGSTGESTGPHLHFEVRLRGASVNPLPALP